MTRSKSRRRFSPLSSVTPRTLVRLARCTALVIAVVLTLGYVNDRLTVEGAAFGSFGLAVALLLAVPDQRSSELLGAAAVWMTVAEFLSAMQDGHFATWRWAMALATLAMVLVPLKVQYLRMLARSNPYRTIGDLDRRAWATGVVPLGGGSQAARRGGGVGPDDDAGSIPVI